MGVSSFFEEVYRAMPADERRFEFNAELRWIRRRNFLLFLAQAGYLTHNCVDESSRFSEAIFSCDMILETEDLYRYVCKFL